MIIQCFFINLLNDKTINTGSKLKLNFIFLKDNSIQKLIYSGFPFLGYNHFR